MNAREQKEFLRRTLSELRLSVVIALKLPCVGNILPFVSGSCILGEMKNFMGRRLRCAFTVAVASLVFRAATAFAECPLAEDQRVYVAEIIQKLTFDLTLVGNNVHERDRGFALTLFGINDGAAGQLLLAQE